ncbi:MAG TPA: metallophosphoesterase, partial [Parasegetibacter sp.]
MRNSGAWWIIVGVMILLDLYVFQVLRFLTSEAQDRTRTIIHAVYWLVSVSALAFMVLIPFVNYDTWPKQIRTYFFAIMVGLFFAKLVAVLFFAADDARRGAMWVVGKLFSNPSVDISNKPEGISRSVFLSWVGMGLGGTLFSSLIFGFRNKYRYRIERIKLSFPNLPSAFKGLRIMHISDIHVGSLMDKHAVQKGVEKIMNEKADIILFTGDLVNDHAREMDHLLPVFRTLEAPLGVYSVLGNHDYGEYALPPGIRSE